MRRLSEKSRRQRVKVTFSLLSTFFFFFHLSVQRVLVHKGVDGHVPDSVSSTRCSRRLRSSCHVAIYTLIASCRDHLAPCSLTKSFQIRVHEVPFGVLLDFPSLQDVYCFKALAAARILRCMTSLTVNRTPV